ncbi:cytochrome c [Sulfitobacter sp. DSM 110093]|uniref:c-type cytochrome n=1 Tax=Sulfitobacter sp. DSM 110093 TaxID=2883127 RepID=UPI001FAC3AAA|nr:cytochrome c [Sulfitobacter sp. DSM 110093]
MPETHNRAKFFAANCASCHGMSGLGDGLSSVRLDPRPTDLTLLASENEGSSPRARALSYIYGDPQHGHFGRVMPQFGGAMASDTVPIEVNGVMNPTPKILAGLLAYLESIQR